MAATPAKMPAIGLSAARGRRAASLFNPGSILAIVNLRFNVR
jgi:hypothetical protein